MNHNPMISIDPKKKEVLGQLTRNPEYSDEIGPHFSVTEK